jgi:HAD superfamily hydrolase (TIGR01484 family)
MKPLAQLDAARARALRGLVFDLDDTLLTHGKLPLDAFAALHQLAEAGLSLVVCTGRPAAWGQVLARQWPVRAVVTENGAVGFVPDGAVVATIDRLRPVERQERKARLEAIAGALSERVPSAERSLDLGRLSDISFDIGELRRASDEERQALRREARALGARTHESAIHLHVTLDSDDKASGTIHVLARLGEEPSAALSHYAFVGDSGNDAPCFQAFRTTFGVAGVRRHLGRLSVAPGYVSNADASAGFVEIAERLQRLRGRP